ncbi:hypothetical protein [Xanthocytophaga agilis]|uniref:Uncharacterized protein n=1 Tax=Xanthocytophaga agilis TaxID=3048010 RepID=A0AAE3RA69_9BACT|nr:hypothetical protein [Xanthocytophaga agilis]MDJ1504357.1 hypothetical protein [Xanthocytophaga agilis]
MNDTDLTKLIKILNNNYIEWVFSRCWDKLIYIQLVRSKVEICYAYYDAEMGYGFQTAEICDKERYKWVDSLLN